MMARQVVNLGKLAEAQEAADAEARQRREEKARQRLERQKPEQERKAAALHARLEERRGRDAVIIAACRQGFQPRQSRHRSGSAARGCRKS